MPEPPPRPLISQKYLIVADAVEKEAYSLGSHSFSLLYYHSIFPGWPVTAKSPEALANLLPLISRDSLSLFLSSSLLPFFSSSLSIHSRLLISSSIPSSYLVSFFCCSFSIASSLALISAVDPVIHAAYLAVTLFLGAFRMASSASLALYQGYSTLLLPRFSLSGPSEYLISVRYVSPHLTSWRANIKLVPPGAERIITPRVSLE